MMQGDSYNLGFRILNNAGNPITPEDIRDLEITIGQISKTYLDARVTFYDGIWMFPLSQKETLDFLPAAMPAQVRVVWANGVIEGAPVYGIRIDESISKEVL